jgi:eukaryotic-like serine/threonine-protein kinase
MTTTTDGPDRDAELDRLCAEYLEAAEAGTPPDRAGWLAAHPHLAADLADFLDCLDTVSGRAAPLRAVAGPGDTVTADFGAAADEADPFRSPPGYEIEGELGRGAMGVVYRARQLAVGRSVAVKTLLGPAGAEGLARFRAEAQAAGRLQHPNIVQVFEVGEHAGRAFIALEYVDGGTLADRAGGAPQPAAWAARTVETLAGAVAAAHAAGIVHRDLKPSNVLLTRDGVPKIADFGLARRLDSDDRLTRSGVIVGTLAYMAPEQAGGRSKDAGPAADVYALGAVLYELLTGRPPFRGETVGDMVGRILGAEPDRPRSVNPAVPRDLETICLKALAKDPADRYPSAGALADDLGRFRRGEPIRARRTALAGRAWRWARRNPASAGLSGLAAALLLVVLGLALPGRADHSVERVQRAGKLRIATDPNYPPMEFYAADGRTPVGFDIDLGRRLAAHLGVEAEFVPIPWDDWKQMAARLDAGDYDAIASTVTATEERKRDAGFVTYLQVPLVFLCKSGGEVRDVRELAGKSVVVQDKTTAQEELDKIRARGIDVRQVALGAGTRETFDILLNDPTVQVALVDEPVAHYYVRQNPGRLKVAGTLGHPMDPQPIGLAFRLRDERLRQSAEQCVHQDMRRDGTWDALLDRWLMAPDR